MFYYNLYIVFGVFGVVGWAVVDELFGWGFLVCVVSCFIYKLGIVIVFVDLLQVEDVYWAICRFFYVYLCVGLFYVVLVWRWDWLLLMCNVINVCVVNDVWFIFLDNVYMYGLVLFQQFFDEFYF